MTIILFIYSFSELFFALNIIDLPENLCTAVQEGSYVKDILVLEEHPSMTLLAQLEAALYWLMVTAEKAFSRSEGQVASDDPSSTEPENVWYKLEIISRDLLIARQTKWSYLTPKKKISKQYFLHTSNF